MRRDPGAERRPPRFRRSARDHRRVSGGDAGAVPRGAGCLRGGWADPRRARCGRRSGRPAGVGGRGRDARGRLAAAERLRRSAFQTLEKVGERGILSTVAAYLGATLHAQGRDEEAIRLTEISERTAADDDLTSQILWRATRAKALARNGNEREAESLAREAVALAQETDCLLLHADALMSLAEVLIARGAAVAAAARLRAALVLYEAKGNVVSAAAARARLESTTVNTPVSRGGRAS